MGVKGQTVVVFSSEQRKEVIRRIEAKEFRTLKEASNFFGISKMTLYRWEKLYGTGDGAKLRYRMPEGSCGTAEMEDRQKDELKEKWKDHPFVEPDPGVESFKTSEDALEYYKLRAEYLENLYMLADSPTDVKKKVLKQLDERIRERMREEGMSV